MPIAASRLTHRSLIGMLVLMGCVSVQAPPAVRPDMPAARFAQILDSLSQAKELSEDEVLAAPRIRLHIPPLSYASTRYVESSFSVSDDAYVLVVAIDLDHRLHVLYPESPEQTGFAPRSAQHRLARLYAGLGGPAAGMLSRYEAQDYLTQRITPFSGGGVLLAVASDRPLQYDRLVGPGGGWDELALERIVFDQNLASAAHALARELVLTGQEYNTDYTTFSGRRVLSPYNALASSSFGACGYFDTFDALSYGTTYGGADGGPITRLVGVYRVGTRAFARYATFSRCGRPTYYDVPMITPLPTRPDTTTRDDSSGTERRRLHPTGPRFPSVTADGANGSAHRLAPRDRREPGREQPVIVSGLRFRPPEQVPSEAGRLTRFEAPRVGDSPARRTPTSAEDGPSMRTGWTRDGGRTAEPVERAEPTRDAPARPEPRMEPRSEPRSEPRPEPVQREPVAEPTQRVPDRPRPDPR
jgi:hypothetical protein